MRHFRYYTPDNYSVQPGNEWKAEHFNETIIGHLGHYEAEHQSGWDIYVQLLTYADKAQVHRSTNLMQFNLDLWGNPSGSKDLDSPTA